MTDDTINLLDFGTNDKGEYVNLVEEEKRLKDISEKEFQEWLENHNDPLVKIAYDLLPYDKKQLTYNEIKENCEWVAFQKVYHYGNLEKDLYVFTLFNGNSWFFVFLNQNHYLVNKNSVDSQKEVEDVLFGKSLIQFNAMAVSVYDLNGNLITEYADQDSKEQDIRHQAVINEWQMNKYGDNRMEKGKKIKDFYEVELSLPKLTEYWGESEIIEDGQ